MEAIIRYETKIAGFEGPLDLLLHLIKEAKLDIHEVKISEITQQYLQYIKAMENLHLEVASEYLVMAANLMLIKSKKLLPKEVVEIDDEYEEDPEVALIKRLAEYQLYKNSIDEFRKLEAARGQFYTKPAIDFSEYLDQEVKLKLDYDASELILAFEKLLRRQKLEAPMPTTILAEKITISDQVLAIKQLLTLKKRLKFSELFQRYDRNYIVVTFLALLELAKAGKVILVQTSLTAEIEIVEKGG